MADKCRVEFSNRQKDVAANKQLRDLIRACCAQTLRREGVEFPCLVSVSFVTKDEIRRLNSQSRGVDAVTDVLSFPLEEFEKGVPEGYRPVISPLPLGDIVLCPARAVEQAGQYGHSVVREMAFLSVHSMLHLLLSLIHILETTHQLEITSEGASLRFEVTCLESIAQPQPFTP